jgi:YHS domain-containing protein
MAATPAQPQPQSRVFQVDGVALGGYDPVAYFDGKPLPGSANHQHESLGVTWRFASAANRARFVADPDRFTPEYGGYCALGMAHGGAVPTDPLAYTVHQGKLYLNSNQLVRITWSYARDWMISRADPNWQAWLNRPATPAGDRRPPPPPPDRQLAAGGFDVTSYFEPAGPTLGDSAHTATWNGQVWRFRSAEHQARFENEPSRYAPQFGGLSPLILAHGDQVPGNPKIFTVFRGKLYFEVGDGPRDTWRRNAASITKRAAEQWKTLQKTSS